MELRRVLQFQYIITGILLFQGVRTQGQQIQFARNYPIEFYNNSHAFVQLNDSGYIIAGECGPASNNTKGLLIRINKYGDTLWTKKFTWAWGFYDIKILNDSSVIVTGARPPIVIWKFGLNGDSLSSKSYDTTSVTSGSLRIYRTHDNGFILTSAAANYGFLKLDSAFNEQWHDYQDMYWGGTLYPDIDGGYIGGGACGFYATPYQVQKRDSGGAIVWDYCYGNMPGSTNQEFETGFVILPDSNYMVSCDGYDWHMMKINRNNGDTLWTKSYSFAPFGVSGMFYYTADKFIMQVSGNLYLINTNADTIWSKPIPFIPGGVSDLHKTSDGGFAYCGNTMSGTAQSIIFVKCDSLGNTIFTSIFNPENNFEQLTFYPNPAANEININPGSMAAEKNLLFTMCDLQGRSVLQHQYNVSKPIDVSTLPEGLYVATLKGKEKEVRGKLVIQR